jgi:hypothetical protein
MILKYKKFQAFKTFYKISFKYGAYNCQKFNILLK